MSYVTIHSIHLSMDIGLFSVWGYYEWSCEKYLCANLFVDACFHLSWINTKSGTTESYVKSTSNFLATAQLFSKVIIPPYNHFEKHQRCLRFLLAPVLHQYLRLSVFHFSNSQRCVMTSDCGFMFPQRDVKQFFMWVLAIHTTYQVSFPHFWSYYWVIKVVSIV